MFRSAPTDRFYIFVLVFAFLLPANLYANQQDEPLVHVRLMRDISPRTIVVSSNQTAGLFSGDMNNPIAQLPLGEKLTLTTSNNQVYLRLSEGGIYARSVFLQQQPDAEITLEVAEAQTIVSSRTYKGNLMVQVDPATPSTLSIINGVGMNDYVESVLSSEFNFRELEASKAVAVSIRTLAHRQLENQHGPEFAIPDNEMWQVYEGTGMITSTVRDAVRETSGEVLRFNGELIEAVYFASSGGRTANNEDVWNASKVQPYLRGKEDPYDYNSPHHNWEKTISRDRLLGMLSDKYRFNVTGIRILNRSRDGRVRTMGIEGDGQQEEIQSNAFRLLVNNEFGRETLKSTFFDVNVQPSIYIFTGKGFGHGVGLNQWGALQLSKKGNLHDEILAYYYTDVQLDRAGLGSQLLTASNTLPTQNGPRFNENYSPIIEASSTGNDVQTIYGEPASNDVAAGLFGDDDIAIEQAEEEKPRRRFRLLRNRDKSENDSEPKNKTPLRHTGKRIGW